ncbi:MAG: hypothetical protein D3922_07785, partial [Candidatus Electrothrix sp. AR1]|nr:hypothetical protein [Candidatus Electrothrix sp. AR1]
MGSAKIIFFLIFSLLLGNAAIALEAPDNLSLQDKTVYRSKTVKYSARNTITAGPSYTVESRGELALSTGQSISLKTGFQAQSGSVVSLSVGWGGDNTAPEIINTYPSGASLTAAQGEPLNLLITFGDGGSGIVRVVLLDAEGNDISAQAHITDNTLTLLIDNPASGEYSYTLTLEDAAGNSTSIPVTFTVDADVPTTTADPVGGLYADSQNVTLTVEDDSATLPTIYYSTDGQRP